MDVIPVDSYISLSIKMGNDYAKARKWDKLGALAWPQESLRTPREPIRADDVCDGVELVEGVGPEHVRSFNADDPRFADVLARQESLQSDPADPRLGDMAKFADSIEEALLGDWFYNLAKPCNQFDDFLADSCARFRDAVDIIGKLIDDHPLPLHVRESFPVLLLIERVYKGARYYMNATPGAFDNISSDDAEFMVPFAKATKTTTSLGTCELKCGAALATDAPYSN
jgi:hypothetical protein